MCIRDSPVNDRYSQFGFAGVGPADLAVEIIKISYVIVQVDGDEAGALGDRLVGYIIDDRRIIDSAYSEGSRVKAFQHPFGVSGGEGDGLGTVPVLIRSGDGGHPVNDRYSQLGVAGVGPADLAVEIIKISYVIVQVDGDEAGALGDRLVGYIIDDRRIIDSAYSEGSRVKAFQHPFGVSGGEGDGLGTVPVLIRSGDGGHPVNDRYSQLGFAGVGPADLGIAVVDVGYVIVQVDGDEAGALGDRLVGYIIDDRRIIDGAYREGSRVTI